MRIDAYTDFDRFAAAASPVLRREPVVNNVPATLVGSRMSGDVPVEADGLWLVVRDDTGEPLGVALRTPLAHCCSPTCPTPPSTSSSPT